MAHELRLTTLGPVTVTLDGENIGGKLPAKALALLVYLVVTARPHSREHLANLLWGEENETKAQSSLRQALSSLKPIADPYLILEKATVAFDRAQKYQLDVEELEQIAYRVSPIANPSAIGDTRYAIREYGDFLDSLTVKNAPEFEVWVLEQREKYRARAAELFQRIVHENLDAGNERAALDAVKQLLALDAWNEDAQQQAMRLLARLGRRKAALAQYRQLRKTLRDDLDIEPSPETTALFERIRDARPLADAPPLQPTPLVGRDAERAELAQLLAQPSTRLLTLFGPGGVGKTRLALAVAEQLRERFLHGSAFVALEAVDAASNVAIAIGAALHFSFSRAGDALTQLGNFLRDKELLLVLDNFEQVVDAANDLARLLQLAPELKILVTSRARLALQWEQVFEVRGLPYVMDLDADERGFTRKLQNMIPESAFIRENPRPLQEPTRAASGLAAYDALALFAARARRLSRAFEWTDANALAAARICRAVEGLPLAIELAAGMTRGAAPAAIAAQLERDLTALDSDLRDVAERHRSVRAVFEQSWRALNERERAVLQTLSVFRGGFDAAAARAVADADADVLAALADQALVQRGGDARFALHALVRELAGECLNASDARDLTHARHAKFFGEFLAARAGRIVGGTQVETLNELRVDFENARAAWQWSVAQRDADLLDRAAPVLYRYHEAQSLYQQAEALLAPAAEISRVARARLGATFYFLNKLEEARRALLDALERAQALEDDAERAFCLLQLGNVAFDAGDLAEAEKDYQACLAYARAADDAYLLTDVFTNRAVVASRRGDFDAARAFCQDAIDAATRIDEKRGIAGALVNLALVEYCQGNYAASRAALERALPAFEAANDQRGVNMTLANLAALAEEAGRLDEAEQLHRRALKGYQEIGQPEKIAQQFRNLGDVALLRKQFAEARRLYRDALAIYARVGARYWEAYTHNSLGEAALASEDAADGEQEFETALARALEIDALPRALDALFGLARVDELQRQPRRAVERSAFVAAHAATEDKTRRAAQAFLNTLASAMDAPTFRAARQQGETTNWLAAERADE